MVVQVFANDTTESGSGTITYSITTGAEGSFVIDSTTGRIDKVGELDREEISVYVLTVQAVDDGATPFASFAQVSYRYSNTLALLIGATMIVEGGERKTATIHITSNHIYCYQQPCQQP